MGEATRLLNDWMRTQDMRKAHPAIVQALKALAYHQDTFECAGCGKCCRDQHPVLIELPEAKLIADTFDMAYPNFRKRYTERIKGRMYIKWDPVERKCPFLAETNRCLVYENRPIACRRFPFFTYDNIMGTVKAEGKELCLKTDCIRAIDQVKRTHSKVKVEL